MRKKLSCIQKQENIKLNNKGFTLVELIVSMAIMIIIGTAMMAFFAFCVRQYQSSNEEVNLQYESQLCWSRLQEQILAANVGISCSSDSIDFYSTDETSGKLQRTQIYLENSDHTLQYQEYTISNDETSWEKNGDAECFASYVTAFTPQILDEKQQVIDSSNNADVTPVKVQVVLGYTVGKQDYEATNIVALRNVIKATDKLADLK